MQWWWVCEWWWDRFSWRERGARERDLRSECVRVMVNLLFLLGCHPVFKGKKICNLKKFSKEESNQNFCPTLIPKISHHTQWNLEKFDPNWSIPNPLWLSFFDRIEKGKKIGSKRSQNRLKKRKKNAEEACWGRRKGACHARARVTRPTRTRVQRTRLAKKNLPCFSQGSILWPTTFLSLCVPCSNHQAKWPVPHFLFQANCI